MNRRDVFKVGAAAPLLWGYRAHASDSHKIDYQCLDGGSMHIFETSAGIEIYKYYGGGSSAAEFGVFIGEDGWCTKLLDTSGEYPRFSLK